MVAVTLRCTHAPPLKGFDPAARCCVWRTREESSAAVPHAPALARRCPLVQHSSARRDEEATRGASATVGRLRRHSPNLIYRCSTLPAPNSADIVLTSLPANAIPGPGPRSHGGSADISLHSVHLDELEWQMKVAVIILNPTFLVFIQLVAA